MGWMQGVDPTSADSCASAAAQFGLGEDAAAKLKRFIDTEGPALQQAGVCPHVLQMIRSLHTGAWFKVGSLESVIVTKSGGRQGCKFGAVIFNVVYAVALRRVRDKLREASVLLVIKVTGDSAFWAPSARAEPQAESCGAAEPHDMEIIEATYVDGQAAMLAPPSPIRLLRAARLLMSELAVIFGELGLIINFVPGKTEAHVRAGRNIRRTWADYQFRPR